jgi:hypothetical protein
VRLPAQEDLDARALTDKRDRQGVPRQGDTEAEIFDGPNADLIDSGNHIPRYDSRQRRWRTLCDIDHQDTPADTEVLGQLRFEVDHLGPGDPIPSEEVRGEGPKFTGLLDTLLARLSIGGGTSFVTVLKRSASVN